MMITEVYIMSWGSKKIKILSLPLGASQFSKRDTPKDH